MKNTVKLLGIAILIALLGVFMMACGDGRNGSDDEKTSYTVTFNANGGIWNDSNDSKIVQVSLNSIVSIPADEPFRAHSTFEDWYTQKDNGEPFNFLTPITEDITLYARWSYSGALPLTDISNIEGYLEFLGTGIVIENPAVLPIQLDFGVIGGAFSYSPNTVWEDLLKAISATNRYIILDIADCTMQGTVFHPVLMLSTGKDKIVSIVFPNIAASIPNGNGSNPIFRNFPVLTSFIGTGIVSIGDYAFLNSASLTEVKLPNVEIIGTGAFSNCTSLVHIELSKNLNSIGAVAFYNCTSLTEITILSENLETIGSDAFRDCTNLILVNIHTETPPLLGGTRVFLDTDPNLQIKVPMGSVEAYKAAWALYADRISAME